VEEQYRESNLRETLHKNSKHHSTKVTFNQIWSIHQNRKKQMQKQLTFISISFCLIIFTSLASPSVRAMVEEWLQFSKVEEGNSYIGWSWENTAGQSQENYQSLQEIKDKYSIAIPFPQDFLLKESTDEHKQYQYSVNSELENLVSLHYRLQTKTRSYNFTATRTEKKPQFSAGTTKDTVIDEEIKINNLPGRLIAIHDMDIYHIYMEKRDWKLVLTVSSDGLYQNKGSDINKGELIKLAESITLE
jgi:hypothetical protein